MNARFERPRERPLSADHRNLGAVAPRPRGSPSGFTACYAFSADRARASSTAQGKLSDWEKTNIAIFRQCRAVGCVHHQPSSCASIRWSA